MNEQVVDGAAVAQLEIDRLPAEQMARAGHDVDGGDAAGLRLLEAGVADVDGVQHADIGLDRRTAVASAAASRYGCACRSGQA